LKGILVLTMDTNTPILSFTGHSTTGAANTCAWAQCSKVHGCCQSTQHGSNVCACVLVCLCAFVLVCLCACVPVCLCAHVRAKVTVKVNEEQPQYRVSRVLSQFCADALHRIRGHQIEHQGWHLFYVYHLT
jgi:hypothetical protein